MSPIDLNKNREEILKTHKDVSDPKTSTNWALFGYDGKSNVLSVVARGDGGIEEFLDELNSGRIMYGYLKVVDPNSNLPKFVFINWQGEGVPELIKGGCASHVREVSNLLKGAHVSINARNEDDVDEESIKLKVSKSSGANYSFHKEQKKDIQPAGPVGSVYEKIKPQIEIKPVLREKFWEDAAKEEQNRREVDKKRLAADKEKLDKEIKERELQDSKKREVRENERLTKAREIKAANQKADAPARPDKSLWEREQEQAKEDETERSKRSDQLRKDRTNEAQKLIASATSQARLVFQHQPASQFENKPKEGPPPRKLKNPFQAEKTKAPVPLPASSPRTPASPLRAPVPPPQAPQEEEDDDASGLIYDDACTQAQKSPDVPEDTSESFYDDIKASHENNDEMFDVAKSNPSPVMSSVLAKGLPKRVESDEEETYDDVPSEEDEALYDDSSAYPGDTGVCAVGVYDYQAAEDNEISFDPEDKITNIEMIDDGWWIGTNKEGKRGMFPANYVELINS